MSEADQAFHGSVKPDWNADGTLVYTVPGDAPALQDGTFVNYKNAIVSETKDVRFAKFVAAEDVSLAIQYPTRVPADVSLDFYSDPGIPI